MWGWYGECFVSMVSFLDAVLAAACQMSWISVIIEISEFVVSSIPIVSSV